jgi:hypothetical protein
MKRRGKWIHIDDVIAYRVSSVTEFGQRHADAIAALAASQMVPIGVVTMRSLFKTAGEEGRSMRDLVG